MFCLSSWRERCPSGHHQSCTAYFCTSNGSFWTTTFSTLKKLSIRFAHFRSQFCLELYSFTDETLTAFIADSVMSFAIRDRASNFDEIRFQNTSDSVRFLLTVGQLCRRSWNKSASILWILQRQSQRILFPPFSDTASWLQLVEKT